MNRQRKPRLVREEDVPVAFALGIVIGWASLQPSWWDGLLVGVVCLVYALRIAIRYAEHVDAEAYADHWGQDS
jgi:hypothetical protein